MTCPGFRNVIGLLAGLVSAGALTAAEGAAAAVKSVVVSSRTRWVDGRSFGHVGPYEKLQGRITFAVDPKGAANARIADLALAPRDARGQVEFTSDFVILRPVVAGTAHPSILLEILNRGHSLANGVFFSAGPSAPFKVEALDGTKLADTFAFDHGFTLMWVGWQFNLAASAVKLDAPRSSVSGLVREAFTPDDRDAARGVDTLDERSYCAADAVQAQATLASKTRFDGPLDRIPRSAWAFARVENGVAIPDPCSIRLPGGFTKGRVYEAVYQGVPPPVAGLGLAAIRDVVSYLKYGGPASALIEPGRTKSRVIGYGYSQSARFLRQYLYQGFTADEAGRKTFDGLFIASAGAGRGSFNHRYAMPGDAGNSVMADLRPVDLFPFTDDNETDPLTGQRDGLLDAAKRSGTLPKIIYTFSSSEYWARAGSLTYTSVDGARELPIDADARLYFFAGTPHAHGPFPPDHGAPGQTPYSNLVNFADSKWGFRALLLDLDDWVGAGQAPPPSVYPHLPADLVSREAVRFPLVPGFEFPRVMPSLWRMDFGNQFATQGIIDFEPPKLGAAYAVRVPQVDLDGNDEGGVALPFLAVALGTYTGWNHEAAGLETFGYISGLIGGFEPFAATKAQRLKTGDTRLSVEERYHGRDDYLAKVRSSEATLVEKRLLLAEDRPRIEAESLRVWDGLVGPTQGTGQP
jgi:hypothetical protein